MFLIALVLFIFRSFNVIGSFKDNPIYKKDLDQGTVVVFLTFNSQLKKLCEFSFWA